MPVQKQKTSKQKRNQRRSHLALTALNLAPCSQCGNLRLPHSVCESCGHYKGRFIPQRYLKGSLSLNR